MLKISDVRTPSSSQTFAVLDVSRSIGKGDPGPVLSIHKGQTAATKAAKKIKHSRVVQLRVALKAGDHPNPLSDLVPGAECSMVVIVPVGVDSQPLVR